MWWITIYMILNSYVKIVERDLICECIGQGEWYRCNNHYETIQLGCMAEQIWAEKEKLA